MSSVCKLSKSGLVITAKGRLLYPHAFKPSMPRGETDPAKAKYQATLVFKADADLKVLEEAMMSKVIEKWGADWKRKVKVAIPIKLSADQPRMLDMDEQGFTRFIRTSSKNKPQVLDAANNAVSEDRSELVYPGRWAKLLIEPWCYDRPDSKGVSLDLKGIQILEEDEQWGVGAVRAENEFEPAEGATSDSLFD
jgi:hypothetical protein